ncbi:synaptotagmin-15-like, partial [Schistocerca nitens]|uniref:synaptotagmin-15-like n=1 Tax=Schistocerca nitens TaxID=7011 RepID=UPI002117A37D
WRLSRLFKLGAASAPAAAPATLHGGGADAAATAAASGTANGSDVRRVATPPLHHGEVAVPVAAAAASVVVVLSLVATVLLIRRRRKALDRDAAGPSIVVYPSHHGSAPQFLTKEISFTLPTLRHAASLDELGGDGDADLDDRFEDGASDPLVPASGAHTQRSNSFSCYGLGAIDPSLYRGALGLDENMSFPEDHLGRVWFSVRYEPATEKLLVSLLKARNLPSRTVATVNACDPFVRLHLLPDERRCLQSKQKKKTCNPYFDETFVFQVPSKNVSDHILKLTVLDAGRAKRRNVIGHVSLPLRELGTGGEQRLFNMDLEKEAQEQVSERGELLVSLLYNENLHRLAVTVIEARNLKFREERRDSYVRVSLQQQYRAVKVKRTATVRNSDCPNFSQCFNFRVPAARLDLTSITLHVLVPVPGYGRDKPIGKAVLGSYMFARGKALAHWNAAISSPMEQVQQWHALSE